MTAAVRYYSRSGNTKKIAEALAAGAGVQAVSVDAPGAALSEKVDVLFIGGALYAYGLDAHLKEYLPTIPADKVGKAVVFSTSAITKHSLKLIRKALEQKGIKVETETFYCKGKEVDSRIAEAKSFAQKYV